MSKGGSRGLLIVLVSVLAVAAAGFAAVNLASGGEPGASSPEAAVEELFTAVGNEDLVGVLEEVTPAERDVMISWFEGLESNLSELGLIDDVDLRSIDGADIEVEGIEASSEEVMSGVARVDVTAGQLSFATDPDSVPVGDVLEDLIEANGGEVDIERTSDQVDLAEEVEEGGDPMFLVATEVDGRWYLSVGYTIAEYARLDSGEDVPDPAARVAPQGAPTPEDAARDFLTAAVDLDVERLISLLPPDEMAPLQTYAPLFLDDAEDSVAEMREEEGYQGRVEGLEFETSGVDGGTRVVPTAGTATLTFTDGELALRMEEGDLCMEASGELGAEYDEDFGTTVVCQGDLGELGGELTAEERAELDELGAMFSEYQAGLVVVERDDGFYVDPLRTFSDLTLQAFGGIDREDLQEGGILYRIFTGESALFPEYEDDFEDYDVDFDDEDGEATDTATEEPEAKDDGPTVGTIPPASVPADPTTGGYDVGFDDGCNFGYVDGGLDYLEENPHGTSFDDTSLGLGDAEYDRGYRDGYTAGYEAGFVAAEPSPCV